MDNRFNYSNCVNHDKLDNATRWIIVLITIIASITTSLITQLGIPWLIHSFKKMRKSKRIKQPKLDFVTEKYNNQWTTILAMDKDSERGFNRHVTIECEGSFATDVRMLGVNDDILWTGNRAIDSSGKRCFWCGPDVYMIEIRLADNVGNIFRTCTASYNIDNPEILGTRAATCSKDLMS